MCNWVMVSAKKLCCLFILAVKQLQTIKKQNKNKKTCILWTDITFLSLVLDLLGENTLSMLIVFYSIACITVNDSNRASMTEVRTH